MVAEGEPNPPAAAPAPPPPTPAPRPVPPELAAALEQRRKALEGQAQTPPSAVPKTPAEVLRAAFFSLNCPECHRTIGAHMPADIHRCIAATYGKAAVGSGACPQCGKPGPHNIFPCMDGFYIRTALGPLLLEQVENLWKR